MHPKPRNLLYIKSIECYVIFIFQLHLVHWNKKYESPNVAAGKPDGLAVLGLLIEVGEKHEEFDKVVQAFDKISCKGDKTSLEGLEIDCAKFLPEKEKAIWTYEGSLTTPPLLESVIWTVFQTPMQISAEQVLIHHIFSSQVSNFFH